MPPNSGTAASSPEETLVTIDCLWVETTIPLFVQSLPNGGGRSAGLRNAAPMNTRSRVPLVGCVLATLDLPMLRTAACSTGRLFGEMPDSARG